MPRIQKKMVEVTEKRERRIWTITKEEENEKSTKKKNKKKQNKNRRELGEGKKSKTKNLCVFVPVTRVSTTARHRRRSAIMRRESNVHQLIKALP